MKMKRNITIFSTVILLMATMGVCSAFENPMKILFKGQKHPTINEARLFASAYAIFSGLVFISVVGILLTPVMHRILYRFHFMKIGPEPSNSSATTWLARYRERITSQLSGAIHRDLPNPGIQIGAVLPVWTSESPSTISWRISDA